MTLGAFATIQARKSPPPSDFFARYEVRGEIPASALAIARIEVERLRRLGDDVSADALQAETDRHTSLPLDSEEAFEQALERARDGIADAAGASRPDEAAVIAAQDALKSLEKRREAWRAIRAASPERESRRAVKMAQERTANKEAARRTEAEEAKLEAAADALVPHLLALWTTLDRPIGGAHAIMRRALKKCEAKFGAPHFFMKFVDVLRLIA